MPEESCGGAGSRLLRITKRAESRSLASKEFVNGWFEEALSVADLRHSPEGLGCRTVLIAL